MCQVLDEDKAEMFLERHPGQPSNFAVYTVACRKQFVSSFREQLQA